MAILKNHIRISRLEGEFSPQSRDSMSTDEDDIQRQNSVSESDGDEEDDNTDSGMGSSDEFDLSELGESGAELCQVGIHSCSVPFELYDLPDLKEILSFDAWNNFLTEEERFSLAEYLPDMGLETFMRTLKELFSGSNFHFGSPHVQLFNMLKGGLCEPRVNLYQQGLNFFNKRKHYHLLRKYQNSMVNNLFQVRDAWKNCRGYGIEERLQVLNIMRSQRSLRYEKMENMGLETNSSGREDSGEGFWSKRLKDIKLGPNTGRRLYEVSPTLNVPVQGKTMISEWVKYRKQNPKGVVRPKGSSGPFTSIPHGLDLKSRPSASALAHPRLNHAMGFDLGAAERTRGLIKGDDDDAEEPSYQTVLRRDHNVVRGSATAKVGLLKQGKKHDFVKSEDDFTTNRFSGLPSSINSDFHSHGRNRNMNQMADREILPAPRALYDNQSRSSGIKVKHSKKLQQSGIVNQMKTTKDRAQDLLPKGSQIDWLSGRHNRTQEDPFSMDNPITFDEWNVRSKKSKVGQEFQTSKTSLSLDPKVGWHRKFSPQRTGAFFHSGYRAKTSQDKTIRNSAQIGGLNMEEQRGVTMFTQSEETESDSSEEVDEGEDITSLRSKFGYPGGVFEARQSASAKTVLKPKKVILLKKDKKRAQGLDGVSHSSKKASDLGERLHVSEVDFYSSKGKQKRKIHDPSYSRNHGTRIMENGFSGTAKLANDDSEHVYKWRKNGQMQVEPGERLPMPVSKAHPAGKKKKGKIDFDYSLPQSNYMHEINEDEDEDEDGFHVNNRLLDDHGLTNRSGEENIASEAHVIDLQERSNMVLSGCNTVMKKRKVKADVTYIGGPAESDYLDCSPQQPTDESACSKRSGKRKPGSLALVSSEPHVSEKEVIKVEPETRSVRKPFTLITPTVHTGFSFSIIHLLSAVRMAMITPYAEDNSEFGKHLEKSDGILKSNKEEQNRKQEGSNGVLPSHPHENVDTNNSEHIGQKNLPALTIQEIVNRVRSNPGDPCILEAQEPLQELVRGVLKLFLSRTAPLGAKGWKPLVLYERSTKSWSWLGPVSSILSDQDTLEEETSCEAWGLPHKMLVKLVDSFANWLKNGQETLQQLGSLPAPPLPLMQPNLDEKERFRDLRAQKSLTTISPSSEEVRAYFRREEVLRYSVPDRTFFYTAADGRKSIVASLRRCGGKPTSKARDHFMLKPDRPPHVTILCLVRDAAARLPGSIGTRADVCTLIRDSQYIVEDVSDAQINQVVSGALDRLHYERDPCVQFDGDRKLWVYLHRERDEEDFEDDGTSSTKKWKKPRKDASDQSDLGTANAIYHGSGEQTGAGPASRYDLSSDLNVEPSSIDEGERIGLVYNDTKPKLEEDIETFTGPSQGNMRHGHAMVWDVLGLNSMGDNKILCQENSTNEDFDDESFSRERAVELLSATLF